MEKQTVASAIDAASKLEDTEALASQLLYSQEVNTLLANAANASNTSVKKQAEAETARGNEKAAYFEAGARMRELGWKAEFYGIDKHDTYASIGAMLRREIAKTLCAPSGKNVKVDEERKQCLAAYLASEADAKHFTDVNVKRRRDLQLRTSRNAGYMLQEHRYLDLCEQERSQFATEAQERLKVETENWEKEAEKASKGDHKKLLAFAKEHPAPSLAEDTTDYSRKEVFARDAERTERAKGNMAACISIATHAAAIMTAVDATWTDGERQLQCTLEDITRVQNALREIRAVVIALMPSDKRGNAQFKKALDEMPDEVK